MSLTTGRTVRLSALALATGTLVATAATGAGAATARPTSTTPANLTFAGAAASDGLALSLNLPAGTTLGSALAPVFSALGQASVFDGNGTLSLDLLHQAGTLSHDATGQTPDVANSVSAFAGGTVGDLLTTLTKTVQNALYLNQQISTTLAASQQHATSNALLGQLAGVTQAAPLAAILDLNAPKLTLNSLPIAGTQALDTDGSSVIAGLDLGKFKDLLTSDQLTALTDELNALIGAATSTTGGAVNTLAGTLSSLTSTIDGILKTTGLPVSTTNALTDLKTELVGTDGTGGLLGQLGSVVASIENGSVVSLGALTTSHTVTTDGTQQISNVASNLADLSLLGGFVTLSGFKNSLTTKAGGTAGTGQVVANPNLVNASVGLQNDLGAIVGPNGLILSGGVLDSLKKAGLDTDTLLAPVNQLISTLQDQLNSLLDAAGVHIYQDKVLTNDVAADGSKAAASLAGLEITVDPLDLGTLPAGLIGAQSATATEPLLDLRVGSLSASSAAAVVTPARTVTTTTPTAPAPKLAYTGADLPLTAGVATVLLAGGAALVIRRRRSGSEI